jgi:DNA-binding MarR family transcriptional regulator
MDKKGYDIEGSFGSIVRRADIALIYRLNQHFQRAGYNITTEQYRILVNLWNKDGQNQQELVKTTRKDKTNITRLIDGLEKRDLVVRISDKKDQRNKLIYLTRKGKAFPRELVKLARRTLGEALSGIPEGDLQMCEKVLLQVLHNLEHASSLP